LWWHAVGVPRVSWRPPVFMAVCHEKPGAFY
jgi:hypothetical protein